LDFGQDERVWEQKTQTREDTKRCQRQDFDTDSSSHWQRG